MTRERKEHLIRMVKDDWRYLGEISKEEQTEEIIDIAMDGNPWAFELIKDDKKKTYERCLRAGKGSWMLLEYVPEELRERVIKELG